MLSLTHARSPDGSVNVLVGDIAKRQAAVNPLNTFYSAKRFMGLAAGSKECDAAAAAVPYGVVAGETEEVEAEADGEDFDGACLRSSRLAGRALARGRSSRRTGARHRARAPASSAAPKGRHRHEC